MSKVDMLVAYQIRREKGREKPFFMRVGRAFKNKDGSMNVFLEALPLPVINRDGTAEEVVINVRPYTPKEDKGGDSFSE